MPQGTVKDHQFPPAICDLCRVRGVLFLDEFPEFARRWLEVMRQPMEDKLVTISRAQGSLTFSANFQQAAAMNPCPCGYYGELQKPCTCALSTMIKPCKRFRMPYHKRIAEERKFCLTMRNISTEGQFVP
jgi:predicted ATPase with chaperone activity